MKAQKLDKVIFRINHLSEEMNIGVSSKEGVVFLSMQGLVLSDGELWYEIPLKELFSVSIVDEEPLKGRLQMAAVDVTLSGQKAERISALRHFLLPYISNPPREKLMGGVLKIWMMGIRDADSVSKLFSIGREEAGSLLKEAEERGLITDGRLTEKAIEYFTNEEIEFLNNMEAE